MGFKKYYKYEDDGEIRWYIRHNCYVIKKEGWKTTIKDLAYIYFKKFEFFIKGNVFWLIIPLKYRNKPKVGKFCKELDEKLKKFNKKFYYDIYFKDPKYLK